mmetsp:Transcript_3729/g.7683  ORF Transcript_3729/g.7683 Transcript_3729/m.7683 type:complete len:164 (-) Transcript_3729:501-992(-)
MPSQPHRQGDRIFLSVDSDHVQESDGFLVYAPSAILNGGVSNHFYFEVHIAKELFPSLTGDGWEWEKKVEIVITRCAQTKSLLIESIQEGSRAGPRFQSGEGEEKEADPVKKPREVTEEKETGTGKETELLPSSTERHYLVDPVEDVFENFEDEFNDDGEWGR